MRIYVKGPPLKHIGGWGIVPLRLKAICGSHIYLVATTKLKETHPRLLRRLRKNNRIKSKTLAKFLKNAKN